MKRLLIYLFRRWMHRRMDRVMMKALRKL